MTTKRLQVYGMVCYACTDILENAVKKVQGVQAAEVNYMTDTMLLRYEETITDLEQVRKAAMKAGYKLEDGEADRGKKQGQKLRQKRKKELRRKILLVFCCSLLLNSFKRLLPGAAKLVLATVVQIVAAGEFYKDAGNGIASRKGNMSLLIAMGTTAGYLYSIYALFGGRGELTPCFENLAAIVTMVLIGRFIELGTRVESSKSLRQLFDGRVETATVLQDGEAVCVKVTELRPGMEIQLRSGEKVPVDSTVLKGSVSVDESAVTGEYFPVDKEPGDTVTGAGYVIKGYAVCRVDKRLEETFLYHLIENASFAMSGKKISIITIVDRIMEYFVPGVLCAAVFSLFFWYGIGEPGNLQKAVQCSLAVLLVACPCALSLAVPLSVIHTIGCAALHGIFIREEGKLEQLGKAEKILFDKTGTLTTGELSVRRFWCNQPRAEEILKLLHEAEKYSSHPVARAIVQFTQNYDSDARGVCDYQELAGGIRAETSGGTLFAGKKEFVEAHTGKKFSDTGFDGNGKVFFSIGDAEGFFAFEDTLREEAVRTVEQLKTLGLDLGILSGDRKENVEETAETLKIGTVYGNLLPEDKADKIERLGETKGIIMVGDGINDLPGMIKSQIGITMGTGCGVLQDCADLIIGSSCLDKIPEVIRLSRAMNRNIRQNLIGSFAYNTIGIIMAISGILSPLSAGFAMSLGSAAVMWNAGRMKKIGNKILENS